MKMYGLAIIFVLFLYVKFAMWVIKKLTDRAENKRMKLGIQTVMALIFLLIPTWDVIAGRVYFNHLCNTKAGFRVYQSVELPAEYWDENGKPKFFNQYSYIDNNLLTNKLEESSTVEHYSSVLGIDKDSTTTREKTSRMVMAETITFRFWGGWISRNFTPHNTAVSCNFINAPNFSHKFYGQLFKRAQ